MSRWRVLVVGLLAAAVLAAVLGMLRLCEPPPVSSGEAFDPDVEGFAAEAPERRPPPDFAVDAEPFLTRHCLGCHNPERAAGMVVLAGDDPALWNKAHQAIRSGRMPPSGKARPEPAAEAAFLRWIESVTPAVARRGTLRRLNRAEYNNTIRDLVGVDFRPAADFPADDTADGFDTSGAVLSVSPTLIEKYLASAEKVIDSAAADPELWRRLRAAQGVDFMPFVLRGPFPQRGDAVKALRHELPDEAARVRAAEIDRVSAALQAFADRAYRRPITHAEMQRLMRFVETALNDGEGADAGLKMALKAVLISPHFLFRLEDEPQWRDFHLATRLSYFLWSSLPDEELFRVAAGGTLREPRVLVGQVRRMLRDDRARALAENFAGQWLQTRALGNDELLDDMRQETERFFDHVARTDRSVLDLLTGEYTFVNERLARHYGIDGVVGPEFRRVSLKGTGRAGVLTQASVLTVTSSPTRTSPVRRGKWILDNLLGTPVPPPPPGADTLPSATGNAVTLRERLELHRTRAECAACHARLDPLGLALENFDALGRRIEPDGPGAAEVLGPLAERPDDFVACLAGKLFTYAIGRAPTPADQETVDRAVRHAARNGYRFSSLVIALVRSEVFQ
jgi:mono/diheme cytochrome c family protein